MEGVLRLTKKKHKGEKSSMAKKCRRAGSVDVDATDDPLKRLAAFRERMFDLKHDEKLSSTTSARSEDAVVLAKWKKGKNAGGKAKKRKTTMGFHVDGDEDDDAMPRITVKKALKKKEQAKKSDVVVAAKSSSVTIPGSSSASTAKKSMVYAADGTAGGHSIPSMKPASHVNSNFKKWKQETSHPPTATAAMRSLAKPKNHLTASEPTGSSVSPSSVVTQDQLVLFEDVLSFEDPLEKAMQAVKEQIATSNSSEKKIKFDKAKFEKKVKKETIRRTATKTEDEQTSSSQKATTEKKKKRRAQVTEDSELEVSIAAGSAQAKTEAVEVSSPSIMTHDEQQQEYDAQAGSSQKAKRKRNAVDPQDAPTSATTTTISTSTTTIVEVSVATATSVSNSQELTPDSPLSAVQKKKMRKKAKRTNKSRARANSVTLTVAADGALVSDSVAGVQAAKPHPETVAQQPQTRAVKSDPQRVDDQDDENDGSDEEEPLPRVATAKKSKVIKSEDVKPTVQSQPTPSTPAKQTHSKVVVKANKDVKPATAAATNKSKKVVERKSVLQRLRAPVSSAIAADSSSTEKKLVVATYQQPQDLTEMEYTEPGDELELMPSDDDDESDEDNEASTPNQVFSNLIDEAARQQWDLVEVGRLVKLFSGQWGHKKSKTARFLRRFCPELVNIDFLEGLSLSLGAKQLVKIFERGSGNAIVLMNKLASAIENGDLNVRDPAFLNIVGRQVRTMATNYEVLEFLVPLLESLSSVRDVSQLLKHVCTHWHVDRTCALVQQILLTSVFDDLDGNQDEILRDLPELERKLDFPSRLDQEDADENGNLIGLIANEDSDLGEDDDADDGGLAEEALGEIHSEDEDHEDEDDDDDEEEPYEGETDSEEERAIRAQHQPKRRSRFILDEADEDDDEEYEDDKEEIETEDDGEADGDGEHGFCAQRRVWRKAANNDSSSSESDSEDETWRSKPKS